MAICTIVISVVVKVRSRASTKSRNAIAPLMFDERIAGLEARMQQGIGEIGERTLHLHRSLTDLHMVLGNDRVRGGWGELTLARTLELSGLVEGRDFDLQVATEYGRPDALVHLPHDRKLVVDAKFPVARFAEAMSQDNDEVRDEQLRRHAQDLLSEAKDLHKRGYHELAAGGFVIMYLPSESLYAESLRVTPELFEQLIRQRVLMAGPTTLAALLGTTAFLLAEHRIVDDARLILNDAKELRTRLETFSEHLAKVGRGLNSASKAYNQAVGSWERRVLPKAGDVAEHVGGKPPASIGRQEETLREVAAVELNIAS